MFYGLTEKEAQIKLRKYGKNVFIKEKSKLSILFDALTENLKDVFNFLMLLASVLSLVLQHYVEALLIFIFFLLNMSLGVWQQYKANYFIEELKKQVKSKVVVIRNGQKKKIDATLLVPGDLVLLSEGDLIPADGKIIYGKIKIDESILTGESYLKEKSKGNYIYKGTFVKEGSAILKVEKTGLNTKIGTINKELIEIKKEPTLLEREVSKLTFLLFKFLIFFSILVLIIGLYFGYSFTFLLLLILSLIIASIPQSLPLLITLKLSSIARNLSKEGILIKKLNSIEEIGIVDYLIFDKTGTITENKLEIAEIFPESNKEEILKLAAVSSFDEKDPVDTLFLKYKDIEADEIKPFNSKDKFSMAKLKDLKIYKGSVDSILELYSKSKNFDLEEFEKWLNKSEELAKKGYKLIMVGFEKDNNFKIKGIIALKAKFRKNIKELINFLKKQVKILILTGDKKETTEKILRLLGLKGLVLDRTELKKMSDYEILKNINKIIAFAELYPEDKLRIIKVLRKKYSVAMVGDGVNDSLALKKANVSIVIGESSNLVKEIADIVLLKPDLALIKKLINEGRNTIFTIKKLILYSIPTNFVELIVGSIGIFIKKLVLTPIQILWINLITDSSPSLIFFKEKKEILNKKDVFPVLNIYDKKFIVVSTLIFAFFVLSVFYSVNKNMFLAIIIWELLVFFFIKYYFEEDFSYSQLLLILIIFALQFAFILIFKEIFGYSQFNIEEIKILLTNLITFSIFELFAIELIKLKKVKDSITSN